MFDGMPFTRAADEKGAYPLPKELSDFLNQPCRCTKCGWQGRYFQAGVIPEFGPLLCFDCGGILQNDEQPDEPTVIDVPLAR
jgi:hypothetical protein